jgi:hypothetical protein
VSSGGDFEFYVAPDDQYLGLLAPSNCRVEGIGPWLQGYSPVEEFDKAIENANAPLSQDEESAGLGLNVVGVLGIEHDQGLFPIEYRPSHGDRVAVFGRWIVDSFHEDYHTEIHPPLIVARAWQPGDVRIGFAPDTTMSTIMSRPFLVSQVFSYDEFGNARGLFAHAMQQIADAAARAYRDPAGGQWDFVVEPPILPGWLGSEVFVSYVVRPPSGRKSPGDELLVDYHFTVKGGVNAFVQNTGDDAVRVFVQLTSQIAYTNLRPAIADPDKKYFLSDFSSSVDPQTLQNSIDDGVRNGILSNWLALNISIPAVTQMINEDLGRGIHMKIYQAPVPVSQLGADTANVRTGIPVNDLPMVGSEVPFDAETNGMGMDVLQPFPIYGFVNVYWKRNP